MSNQFLKLRRSSVPGKIPDTSSLDFGEIALNTYDGVAFMKKSGSGGEEIVVIGSSSGSFTGSFSGSFSGSFFGTSSWSYNSLTASYVNALNETVVITGSIVFDGGGKIVANEGGPSGSIGLKAGSPAGWAQLESYDSNQYVWVDNSAAYVGTNWTGVSYQWEFDKSGSFNAAGDITIPNSALLVGTSSWAVNAATASYAENLSVSGSITASNILVTNTITAQTLLVSTISSSIIYSSGSNIFGDELTDRQQFTGSVTITGSLSVNNSPVILSSQTSSMSVGTSSYSTNINGAKNHVPLFNSPNSLVTSSIYQSGSFSVIINQDNNTTDNPEALFVSQTHPTSINVISGKGNLDNYLQLNIFNTNQGTNASSDVVATANNGNENINYIDMGINSENYSGVLGGPNAAYLYSTGQHLHIGNASNYPVQFFAGGIDSDANRKLELNPSGLHNITGSLEISDALKVNQGITGSLLGTATNALTASYFVTESVTSASYSLTASSAIFATSALTASYFVTQSVTNATSASYAATASSADSFLVRNNLTASNALINGTQILNGNLFMSGAFRLIYNNDSTNNMLFGMFDGSNIYGPYYQLFGNQYSNIDQRGSAEFVYDNRNSGGSGFNIASFNGSTWTRKFRVDDNGTQVTGSLVVTGGITGSLFGTSSQAISSSYSLTASSAVFAASALTASYFVTESITSASYALTASSAIFATSALTASYFVTESVTSASYALTASSATFAASALTASYFVTQSVTNATSASNAATASSADSFLVRNNLTASNALINGTVTAQTLVVQTVSSSVIYSSGSNIFGDELTDRQMFTGSVSMTGSLFASLTDQNLPHFVSYNTASGQFFYASTGSFVATSASYALTASSAVFATSALTASYFVTQSVTSASYALTASSAVFATSALTASYFVTQSVTSASIATSASYALTASSATFAASALTASYFVTQSVTSASYALTASSATFSALALTASYFVTQSVTSASYSLTASSAIFAANALTASYFVTQSVSASTTSSYAFVAASGTGSFTGSFSGDGSGLTNISASSVIGLNLSLISSGSVTASTDPAYGFKVNSNSQLTGSTQITGSLGVTGSVSISGSAGTLFTANVDTLILTGSFVTTGSIQLTGSMNVLGGVTSSLFGTASQATSASYSLTASSAVFAASALTASYFVTESVTNATSASYAATASSADSFLVRNNLTASNALITNTITAQTLVVQTVSSSVIYSSGSNTFGDELTDRQMFTGSVSMTGSLFASLTNQSQPHFVSYNSQSGQFFYSATSSFTATSASYALTASSAVFAANALTASYFVTQSVTSASYALTASSAIFAASALTASYFLTESVTSASYALTASSAIFATSALTASYFVTQSVTSASYALTASSATFAASALTASYFLTQSVTSASIATSASYALTASSAIFATSALTASYFVTQSVTSASIATSASYALTASFSQNSISSSYLSGSAAIITNLTSSNDASINGLIIGRGGGNSLFNTAFGNIALAVNTTGTGNVAIGSGALNANSTGLNNTAIGRRSLLINDSGSNNIAIGRDALLVNTTGSFNTALGVSAIASNGTGNNNTAIGYRAGYGVDGTFSNDSGTNNIFIGYQSVGVSTSDSNRTWIGNSSTTTTWLGGNLLLGSTSNNGYIAQINVSGSASGSLFVSGSSVMSGSLTVTQGITGSLFGTASWAQNSLTASYFVTQSVTSASYALTASSAIFATSALTASYFVTQSVTNATSASYAATASSADNFLVRSNLTASNALINGTITAQTLVVTTISSSVIYSSGSNTFGDDTSDRQMFTGSVSMSGSLSVNGPATINNLTGSLFGTASQATSASYSLTASSAVFAASALTASYFVTQSVTSASYALTASSAIFAASALTASYFVTQSVTSASYALTASSAIRATSALTASYFVTQSVTSASYALTASSAVFATSALTASYFVTQSVTSASYALSSSFATTASYVLPLRQDVQITGSLLVSGSTTQIGNNTLLGNTTLSGSIIISGSTTPGSATASVQIYGDIKQSGYHRFDPVTTNIDTSISASYIFVSGSTNDLYFAQNGQGYTNTTRLRWLEGNLYSGLLNGGLITTQSSTVYQISSGSGIIVDLNASFNDNPYPTVSYLNWSNLSASIAPLSASYDQTFVAIDDTGNIFAQGTPYADGQYNTTIPIGVVLHQNRSTINGTQTFASLAYGWKQRSSDFIRAFGPLKLSGLTMAVSGSTTGSLIITSGTAWSDGRNYSIDPNNPSYITDSGTTTSKIFRYRQSGSNWVYDTNGGAGYPTIDPSQYSNNGVLTSVGAGNWSIQRVFWFPNSVTKAIYVYYGNAIYATEADAIANLNIESFVEAPNTAAQALYIGAIVISGNGVFTNTSTFKILPGGLFRSVGGSGGGGSAVTQTLSGLSDVAISGPTDHQPLAYSTTAAKWINTSTISASLAGNAQTATTASFATTASYVLNAVSSSYALTASSAVFATSALTASYFVTQSVTNATSASFAATASSADSFLVRNNLTASNALVNGTITAQTLVVTTISSSVIYSSGSNTFGDDMSDRQMFTGSVSMTGSLTVTGRATINNLTGSLFGTSSWASNALTASYFVTSSVTSASYALTASSAVFAASALTASYFVTQSVSSSTTASFAFTASSVNTLNQNVLITGSLTVGATTLGSNENTLVLGPSPAGGAGEGGQILLQAPGGTYTSASMWDNYQNFTRLLRGTNASSDAVVAQFNMHTKQVIFPAYNSVSSFVGTAAANLAVDSSGNVITVSTTGGTVFPYTGLAVISGSLQVTGSAGITGSLQVTSNVTATSFTGSLFGTASWASNALTASYFVTQSVTSASYALTASSAVFAASALTASYFVTQSVSSSTTASYAFVAASGTGSFTGSFFGNGAGLTNISASSVVGLNLSLISSGSVTASTDPAYGFKVNANSQFSGSTQITGSLGVTGSFNISGSTGTLFSTNADTLILTGSLITTGSIQLTGSMNVLGGVTSSLFGTASQAASASYSLTASSAVFATSALTASYFVTQSVTNATSASFAATASSADNFLIRSNLTASNALVNGTITAQTLVVTTVSSSVIYSSGSNTFGDDVSDRQMFTGSVTMSGSLTVTGRATLNNLTGSLFGTSSWAVSSSQATSASYALTASSAVFATSALTASYFVTSSVTSASYALTASSAIFAASALTASYFVTQSVTSASYALTASSAVFAASALTASYFVTQSVTSASYAATSSYANNFTVANFLYIDSASLDYQQNLNVTTGSYQTIVSVATGSYKCAFFDYVTFSASVSRAGTVYTIWSGSTTEYTETYTNDIGGSTSVVDLRTAISGSNIQLQAGISGSAWTVRSLVRLL